jgi:hypothetical protein
MLRHVTPRWLLAVICIFSLGVLVAACDEADAEGGGDRTCGDEACSQSTCETQATCPTDCGVCTGPGCAAVPTNGSCGEACGDTCDCISPHELCTADYGDLPGRCVPVGCRTCPNFDACNLSPDANGFCADPTCS